MAPIVLPTTAAPSTQLDTQVIVLICVLAYLVLFGLIIIIRQCIVSRGLCGECNVCGKAEETNNCCDCCIGLAQACDCSVPGSTTCCDRVCGPRRHCDIADCLTCGLCGGSNCSSDISCCQCPDCSCGFCDCPTVQCETPECDCSEIHCLCCKIRCGDGGSPSYPPGGYPFYPYPPPDPNFPYNYPYPSPVLTQAGTQFPYPSPVPGNPGQHFAYPTPDPTRSGPPPPSPFVARSPGPYPSYPYSGHNYPTTSQPMRPLRSPGRVAHPHSHITSQPL